MLYPPSKHEAFNQYSFNVGTTCVTLVQHYPSTGVYAGHSTTSIDWVTSYVILFLFPPTWSCVSLPRPTVHYKEPLKSFEVRVGIVPASGFLLSRYCHDCAESDVKQYSYRDPRLHVSENYSLLLSLRPSMCKSWCSDTNLNNVHSLESCGSR